MTETAGSGNSSTAKMANSGTSSINTENLIEASLNLQEIQL